MSKASDKAFRFFGKIKTLNAMVDGDDPLLRQGATKAKKALTMRWTRRGGNNTKGCYNPAAKSGICVRIEL